MTECKLSHEGPDVAIPRFVCRTCNPGLLKWVTPAHVRKARDGDRERQALMRQLGDLKMKLGQAERAEKRGGDKHGISAKKVKSYTRRIAETEAKIAELG